MNSFPVSFEPRIKTATRNVLREILLSIALTAIVIMIWDSQTNWSWIAIIVVILVSIPPGIALWAVFRILRFALGPWLRWRPLVR